MVALGSGAQREIEDIALTRYACRLPRGPRLVGGRARMNMGGGPWDGDRPVADRVDPVDPVQRSPMVQTG